MVISRKDLAACAQPEAPATRDAIAAVEASLGIDFPSEFIDLLLLANGCVSSQSDFDVFIYGTADIAERNQTNETQSRLGEVLRIAGDGGGRGFHLDLNNHQIIAVDDGCPSITDGFCVAASLESWIKAGFQVKIAARLHRVRTIMLSFSVI